MAYETEIGLSMESRFLAGFQRLFKRVYRQNTGFFGASIQVSQPCRKPCSNWLLLLFNNPAVSVYLNLRLKAESVLIFTSLTLCW